MATDIGYRMTGYALTDIIFDTVLGGGGVADSATSYTTPVGTQELQKKFVDKNNTTTCTLHTSELADCSALGMMTSHQTALLNTGHLDGCTHRDLHPLTKDQRNYHHTETTYYIN